MSELLPHTHELKQWADRDLAGYPVATIAYFGPHDQRATKVVVAILPDESFRPSPRMSWTSEGRDLRDDEDVNEQILRVIKAHGVATVVMDGKILGCPHQVESRRPAGFVCAECSFWADKRRRRRDRSRETAGKGNVGNDQV